MPVVIDSSKYRHWVDLSDPKDDGSKQVYSPSRVKCAIQPQPPGAFDEGKVTHVVTTRYHSQISTSTMLMHKGRRLFVKGVQNIDEMDREMVLLCEEVSEQ